MKLWTPHFRPYSTTLLVAALLLTVGCQKRGEAELTLTQEQWRRVRPQILSELPTDKPLTSVETRFGDYLLLHAVEGLPERLPAGSTAEMTLYWEVLAKPPKDLQVWIGFEQNEQSHVREHLPLNHQLPLHLWETGMILHDTAPIWGQASLSGSSDLVVKVTVDGEPLQTESGDTKSIVGRTILVWEAPRLQSHYTDERILIDGLDSESAWKEASTHTDFKNSVDGSDTQGPETTVRSLWNDQGLYLFIRAEDAHIWGTITVPDTPLWEEESLHVFLDAGRSYRDYLEIAVNPLNIVFDAKYDSASLAHAIAGKHAISGLRSAVFIDGTVHQAHDTDRSWAVEMFIPFGDIPNLTRQPNGRPSQVGVNFARYDRPDEATLHQSVWSPTGESTLHRPERFGLIEWVGTPPVMDPAHEP